MTTEIVEYSKTEAALAGLAQKYKGVLYDCTTSEGLAAAKAGRKELKDLRVSLEKVRVQIKEPALRRTQLIDSEARRITHALEELEDPIDKQIKAEEERREWERTRAEREAKEKAEAEERARKEAEERRLAEERAKLEAERAAFEKQQAEARAAEEARRRAALEAEERAMAARRAEEERQAAARRAQEEEARRIREAEEARLRKEREALEAERRAAEERERQARLAKEEEERKARQAAEAKERERQRKIQEKLDAVAMLRTFVKEYGHLKEYASVVKAIEKALNMKVEA